MASRKFGWHSGTLTAQDGKFRGDLYVQDDIVFSDVSAGTLGVTGGIDMSNTTSAIGIDLGGTFSTAAINVDGTAAKGISITGATTAIYVTGASADDGAIYVGITGRADVTTGYETFFKMEGNLDSTGSAGGVKTRGLHINLSRSAAIVANGDSRDQALKIDIKDSVGDHTAGYFIRAMDVKSEFDASGKTITALYGVNFTAEVDNGTATDYMNASFNSKCDGIVTNDLVNVRIYDESQGSITGDLIGLQFATKNVAPATGIREHVMEVTCADSTGWQNLFHFTDAAGGTTTCDTDAICTASSVDSDGAIRVDIAGTAYYIPVFNAAHTTNSW